MHLHSIVESATLPRVFIFKWGPGIGNGEGMILKLFRGMFNGLFTVASPVLNWVLEKTESRGWFGGFIDCDSPRQLKWDFWRDEDGRGGCNLNWGHCEIIYTPHCCFKESNRRNARRRDEQRIRNALNKAELRMQRPVNRRPAL